MLFWSRESKKPIFRIFPDLFYEKIWKIENRNFSGNRNLVGLVIASETPW